jgi:hypothetical protein
MSLLGENDLSQDVNPFVTRIDHALQQLDLFGQVVDDLFLRIQNHQQLLENFFVHVSS